MSTENKLENLEFFESFMDTDPLEDFNNLGEDNSDPNANIAPDILNGEEFDPLKEEESNDDEPELPKPKETSTPTPEPEEEEEEEEENIDDDGDEDESDNPFEVFAKGLAQAGILDLEDEENQVTEWDEKNFINVMEKTVDNKMWAKMEELAMETYGEAGVKLIEDILINKVPVPEYLQMFSN